MNALIVAKSDKAFMSVVHVLKMCGHYGLVRADNISQARVLISERRFGIAVVCADSRDSVFGEMAGTLSDAGCGTVLITTGGAEGDILPLYDRGVQIVAPPLTTLSLYGAIKTAQGISEKLLRLAEENVALKKKLETLKAVSTAKCLLIERGMTESEAHKEIERSAMEQRKTRLEIANDIIERLKQ